MDGHWKPCIINVEVRIQVPKMQNTTHKVSNSRHIAHLVNIFGFGLQ